MTKNQNHKGTWTQRILIRLFTVAFGVLTYWLLGFIVGDLGQWPGPNYNELESQLLDPQFNTRAEAARENVKRLERQTVEDRDRQSLLRESANSSQTTLNQLLSLQQLSLEKGALLSDEVKKTLVETQQLFIANQREYQALNDQIARRNEELNAARRELEGHEQALARAKEPVAVEYQRLSQHHSLRVAMVKLAVLIPLLVMAFVIFLRLRSTTYAPLAYAGGIAILLKVGIVMHEYFPRVYFKYILIVVTLTAVIRILLSLLRGLDHPRAEWLQKQYREAYETFFCPVCDFPIRRGPHRFLYWTRGSIKQLSRTLGLGANPGTVDETYTCPNCGTCLFEECSACHGVRHSLLPNCQHCGVSK